MIVVRNRHLMALRRTDGRRTARGRNASLVVAVARAQTREFRMKIIGIFGQFKLPATIAEPDHRLFNLMLWHPDEIGVAVVVNIFGEQATVAFGRRFEMEAARLRVAKSDMYAFVYAVRPDLRLIRELILIEISVGLCRQERSKQPRRRLCRQAKTLRRSCLRHAPLRRQESEEQE